MGSKPKARIAASAVFCGVAGPLLGLLLLALVRSEGQWRLFVRGVNPGYWIFALIWAGPYGIAAGIVGANLLQSRAQRRPRLRTFMAGALIYGAVLGALYPVVTWSVMKGLLVIFSDGNLAAPPINVRLILPAAGAGTLCALRLVPVFYVRNPEGKQSRSAR